jgi:hypothetical protein
MDIWQRQKRISKQLLAWAGVSVAAGVALLADGRRFQRGMAAQFITWGVIDGAIALGGMKGTQRRQAQLANPNDATVLAQETRKLRRLLLINAGLDVLYVAGGSALRRRPNDFNQSWEGHGLGIIIQGAFLLIFDTLHALTLPQPPEEDGT